MNSGSHPTDLPGLEDASGPRPAGALFASFEVVAPSGEPIASPLASFMDAASGETRVVVGDEEGLVDVGPVVIPGARVTLSAASFRPAELLLDLASGPLGSDPVRVQLTQGRSVEMEVVRHDGRPAAGARLFEIPQIVGFPYTFDESRASVLGLADERGRALIAVPPGGAASVGVLIDELFAWAALGAAESHQRIVLPVPVEVTAELALPSAGTGGFPAVITWTVDSIRRQRATVLGARELLVLPRGELVDLQVDAAAYISASQRFTADAGVHVVVTGEPRALSCMELRAVAVGGRSVEIDRVRVGDVNAAARRIFPTQPAYDVAVVLDASRCLVCSPDRGISVLVES